MNKGPYKSAQIRRYSSFTTDDVFNNYQYIFFGGISSTKCFNVGGVLLAFYPAGEIV